MNSPSDIHETEDTKIKNINYTEKKHEITPESSVCDAFKRHYRDSGVSNDTTGFFNSSNETNMNNVYQKFLKNKQIRTRNTTSLTTIGEEILTDVKFIQNLSSELNILKDNFNLKNHKNQILSMRKGLIKSNDECTNLKSVNACLTSLLENERNTCCKLRKEVEEYKFENKNIRQTCNCTEKLLQNSQRAVSQLNKIIQIKDREIDKTKATIQCHIEKRRQESEKNALEFIKLTKEIRKIDNKREKLASIVRDQQEELEKFSKIVNEYQYHEYNQFLKSPIKLSPKTHNISLKSSNEDLICTNFPYVPNVSYNSQEILTTTPTTQPIPVNISPSSIKHIIDVDKRHMLTLRDLKSRIKHNSKTKYIFLAYDEDVGQYKYEISDDSDNVPVVNNSVYCWVKNKNTNSLYLFRM
ncbi:hypothetical protein A3Q56_01126 [Intoshia linei]|uniref:DIX domain-containing protein n=1 Tax=Intoshia linei TaxID=1819745 RepID=A0A177BC47_9BILA|nr:hypothetical protein A3Q56_01126 [Intoshia linei]